MGHVQLHPSYRWLWGSKCQPKHNVFFWLLLRDRLNTRGMLKRRNMYLESYTCENCILQREETLQHLFLCCPFAKNCWNSIGVLPPRTANPEVAVTRIKRQLQVPCYMEIIILMSWSIWKCRNGWIFDNIPPTVEDCRESLRKELLMVVHRANHSLKDHILQWLE